MISNNCFTVNFQEHVELYGWKLTKDRLKKIWHYLCKMEFQDSDLIYTLQRYESDVFRFVDFLSVMKSVRAERTEKENEQRKEQEEDEVRQWFAEHPGSKQACINDYQCGECKRVYCDIVATEAQNMTKKILSREISSQEAHQILAEKFKGIGFEQHTGIEPF